METLAFLHLAVDYENPGRALKVRSLHEWLLSPAAVGAVAIGVAVASQFPAQALMRYGDAGQGVSDLQAQLNLRADGVYGDQTARRVRSFQAARGLRIDGIAGPATLSALGLNANLSANGNANGNPNGNNNGYVTVADSAVVTAQSGLIVRDRPNGDNMGGVGRGERVALSGDRQYAGGRAWVQLAQGGWIAEDYISYGGNSGGNSGGSGGDNEVPVKTGAYVSSRIGLIVRDRPNGYEIGGLATGERVDLTGDRSDAGGRSWLQLQGGGWVAAEYISYQ